MRLLFQKPIQPYVFNVQFIQPNSKHPVKSNLKYCEPVGHDDRAEQTAVGSKHSLVSGDKGIAHVFCCPHASIGAHQQPTVGRPRWRHVHSVKLVTGLGATRRGL